MRSRYNRGSGDSALLKLLFFGIASMSVFALVLGIFNPKSASAPNLPPPAPIDPPGLDLCTPKQLDGYVVKSWFRNIQITQGTEELNIGAMKDGSGWLCDLSGNLICDATWKTKLWFLCTDHSAIPIRGLEYIPGSFAIENCKGDTCFNIGDPRFNCHGDTFGHDEYWIQDPEVQKILDDDYVEVAAPSVGDVIIYRESPMEAGVTHDEHCKRQHASSAGSIVHSATWVGAGPPGPTFGKGGFEPRKVYRELGPGPGTQWKNADACVSFYHKK